jgi:hypothetical protein
MKTRVLVIAIFGVLACSVVSGQSVKRTISKSERLDFGPGGTITVLGAPAGAIRITGTNKREIEVTADIELTAPTEADVAKLAEVTTFLVDDSPINASVVTVGTHNKLGDKKFWKKFPRHLMGLPFRIDYTISVPRYSDLSISGGKGDILISGIEGGLRINSLESNARLELVGGYVSATFGSGTVDVTTPNRSWRGSMIEIALGRGDMNVELPNALSAALNAAILRSGRIENTLAGLVPVDRKAPFTETSIVAVTGSGGIPIKLTVAEGTLRLRPIQKAN